MSQGLLYLILIALAAITAVTRRRRVDAERASREGGRPVREPSEMPPSPWSGMAEWEGDQVAEPVSEPVAKAPQQGGAPSAPLYREGREAYAEGRESYAEGRTAAAAAQKSGERDASATRTKASGGAAGSRTATGRMAAVAVGGAEQHPDVPAESAAEDLLTDFDLRRAVVYSELLRPKFQEDDTI